MKKVMLAAMLLVSTASVFATETKGSEKETIKKTILNTSNQTLDECTVSITGKIGPSFAQVEVKCAYTSSTCKEALSQVQKCIEDAKRLIMQ